MSNLIDLFKSAKLDESQIVGDNKFFATTQEITEETRLQRKFISDVDFSNPENFARFGLAEEYYKNVFINTNSSYPYDGSREQKLSWINNLTDFEYYFFNNEYPKSKNYMFLSASQQLRINNLGKDYSTLNTQDSFQISSAFNGIKTLDFGSGVSFESWVKLANSTSSVSLLQFDTLVSGGSGYTGSVLAHITCSNNNLYVSGSGIGSFTFNYHVPEDTWEHYAIRFKKNEANLFVNGTFTEKVTNSVTFNNEKYYIFRGGFIPSSSLEQISSQTSIVLPTPVKIGSGSTSINFDETRFWNEYRTVEEIGRYWFVTRDGNNFSATSYDKNLLFYFKYNEQFSGSYSDIVLDYSGFQNHGAIFNQGNDINLISGSAIELSGLVEDKEVAEPIIAPEIFYSTTLLDSYNTIVEAGKEYDITNIHTLYKKFPSWVLEQEEDLEVKNLKQLVQIVCVYFDDLYNKIGEISKLKHLQNTTDSEKLYPFYDTILTSTGFDVSELFNNLDIIEKIASRNDTDVFEQDVQKVKNTVLQNIYNNLSYILKAKGTEKSLKSFLRVYGLNENLVKINLYADKSLYNISERTKEEIIKKKTIHLTGSQNIFLSSSAVAFGTPVSGSEYTLEACFKFPQKPTSPSTTNSLFGFYVADNSTTFNTGSRANIYLTLENSVSGNQFFLRSGSAGSVVGSSSYFDNIYDNTPWNIAIRIKPDIDTIFGSNGTFGYRLEAYGINTNSYTERQFEISGVIPNASMPALFYNGFIRYYLGARNNNISGSNLLETDTKYVYSNFWKAYLDNETLATHNRELTDYGFNG